MISLQTFIDNLTPMERAEAARLLLQANELRVKRPNALGHINSTGRPKGAKNRSKLQQGQDRIDGIAGRYHGV
jgi:hypothetical protein